MKRLAITIALLLPLGVLSGGVVPLQAQQRSARKTGPPVAHALQMTMWQQHNLEKVNFYRAKVNVPPLKLDPQMNTFAQAGSQELMDNHIPHKHVKDAGTPYAENQGYSYGVPIAGWPNSSDVNKTIDGILQQMWDEGPSPTGQWEVAHGHYMNMANASYKSLGVGLVVDKAGGKLYLTNDFK